MSNDVNPFEPWRPRPEPHKPDGELDPSRPWRPAGYSGEPSPPAPEPPRREVNWSHERFAPPEPPRPPTSPTASLFVALTVALVAVGGILVAVQGGAHFGRVAACVGALWLGGAAALLLKRPAWARAVSVVGGLAVAVACWEWVPTLGGINRREAARQVEAAKEVGVGDVDAFEGGAAMRKRVAEEWPGHKKEIEEAETSWRHRTAAHAASRALAFGEGGPRHGLKELNDWDRRLRPYAGDPEVAAELSGARRKLVQALLKADEAAVARQIDERRFKAAARGMLALERDVAAAGGAGRGEVEAAVGRLRRRAVQEHGRAAHDALVALVKRKDFAGVAREGKRLTEELRPEAERVELWPEVAEPLKAVRVKAVLARVGEGEATMRALAKKGDHAGVTKEAWRLARELLDEAVEVGVGGEVGERLAGPRREALRARVEAARQGLAGLLEKGELARVAEEGARHERELRLEAGATGQAGLMAALDALRRQAMQRRAAEAGRGLEALVKTGEAARVPAAAEKALKELEGEALAVGLLADVRSAFEGLRRKAWRARLEGARAASRGLIAKDQFEALEKLGRGTEEELRAEAAALGLAGELEAFVRACEGVADLARRAKKKDRK